jgi:AcrR family transcriptional regulator
MPRRGAATSDGQASVLPSGVRDSFGHGHMEQIQRARILAATVQAAYELGVANVTVANVVERAGVSRRTFYEIFSDCEACLLAALEDGLTRAGERVLLAYETEQGAWRLRIRAGLVALLEFFDERPQIAHLLVVEWLAAGPRALERRRQLLERLAGAVDRGRGARPGGGANTPELTAEGVVGGVASVLHARLLESHSGAARAATSGGDRRGLHMVGLVNPLMAIVVQPYLGAAAARRELQQALPATGAEGGVESTSADVLSGLKMRLTYRTMRVLAAVAAHPGGSNRVVAVAAGIGDQGQISKLLMRLQKLGLLENGQADATTKGIPNAWSLTATGQRVARALSVSPDGHADLVA